MRRFEAALRSAINTPHEPLKEKPGPRQNWERYDPKTNTWQSHAPMLTQHHAAGATTIGDTIYVAGGGAVTGGSVRSSVHEAFTLVG
jgi:hypothetical protein